MLYILAKVPRSLCLVILIMDKSWQSLMIFDNDINRPEVKGQKGINDFFMSSMNLLYLMND